MRTQFRLILKQGCRDGEGGGRTGRDLGGRRGEGGGR